MLLFAAFVLLTSFVMLAQARIVPLIHTFAWQGAARRGHGAGGVRDESSAPVLLRRHDLVLEALLIPWMLQRLAVRLNIHRDIER